MRGLACVLMFQTHCYDAWLTPAARQSKFFMYSQLTGSLPAPLFLFLAGISAALITRNAMKKQQLIDGRVSAVAGKIVRRGLQIWALALAFRLQEYLIVYPWAPWTDLFRMDVLNCIGVSLVLIGLLGYVSPTWKSLAINAGVVCAAISALSPLVWTHRAIWLPWPLESYLDGVHNLGKPLPWLFPIFPWAAFAFAGVVAGYFILSDAAKRYQRILVPVALAAGIAVSGLGYFLDHLPLQLYANYDFWHTSPNFFLIRLGILVVILALCDARCRLRPLITGFRPLSLLGQHSLAVYWVHIELVYGRLHILRSKSLGITGATMGLIAITLAMLLLAYLLKLWDGRAKGKLLPQRLAKA
jgi:uncharacterized membrane protein